MNLPMTSAQRISQCHSEAKPKNLALFQQDPSLALRMTHEYANHPELRD